MPGSVIFPNAEDERQKAGGPFRGYDRTVIIYLRLTASAAMGSSSGSG